MESFWALYLSYSSITFKYRGVYCCDEPKFSLIRFTSWFTFYRTRILNHLGLGQFGNEMNIYSQMEPLVLKPYHSFNSLNVGRYIILQKRKKKKKRKRKQIPHTKLKLAFLKSLFLIKVFWFSLKMINVIIISSRKAWWEFYQRLLELRVPVWLILVSQ